MNTAEGFENHATTCGVSFRTVRVSDRLPDKKGTYFTIWPAIDIDKNNMEIPQTGLEVNDFNPENSVDKEYWKENIKMWLEEMPEDNKETDNGFHGKHIGYMRYDKENKDFIIEPLDENESTQSTESNTK